MTNATNTTATKEAKVGVQFMSIMGDYLTRQQGDPNFDPSTEIYGLYDDLVTLYLSCASASIESRINPQDNYQS